MDVETAVTNNLYWYIFTISEIFTMRYPMTLYLKGYQKGDSSKLKVLLLFNESSILNYDLLYFWYRFKYRVKEYLIGKLSDMVTMIQEGKVVTVLSSLSGRLENWEFTTQETGIIVPRTFINFCSFSHPYAPYSRPYIYQYWAKRFKIVSLFFFLKKKQICFFFLFLLCIYCKIF